MNNTTIKQNKIMIHNISRYLLTLVALLAMTTGAWAQDVTINDAKTEASFTMPESDVTLEYLLVRNLASNMTANVIIGEETLTANGRLRLTKSGDNYVPAVALSISLTDASQQKTLTAQELIAAGLSPQFYLKGEEGWVALGTDDIDAQTQLPKTYKPGQVYCLELYAPDTNEKYGNRTAKSFEFELYEPITVTFAKGYTTNYYAEGMKPLAEQTGLKFYAVSAVSETAVTLNEITDLAVPAGTPFIAYNSNAEAMEVVMDLPSGISPVTTASEFKGTAEAKEMSAQANCYVLRNGDATPTFRLVEGAGVIPAHRCWIQFSTAAAARSLGFDFGNGTTSIRDMRSEELKDDKWFDLQGRQSQTKAGRKGVYIQNGQKVIIK